ncbi:MAG: DUF2585 family protein [Fulvimarina manganoxydans]|uniref:DUF2585 family protein n=1 Tax=Fulvimarina manganoxydans TaxID=937218 RepID=UPI002357253D|nr:DUF2585 family protein [Fulvimarina manganoxydans]MCK5933852.1 DUF2585 family protein [Fulvimarina manganoxydans]
MRSWSKRLARFFASRPGRGLVMALLVALMIVWFRILGRPLTCTCGTIEFWQGSLDPAENSQQFSDWYSALHVIFGMGLYAFLKRMRPAWPRGALLTLAIASSVLWEAMENTPALIAMFDGADGAPAYSGDSVLNALGDTLFVAIGFHLAAILPVAATAFLAMALELTVALGAHDGFVIGTARLLGLL